MYINFRDHSVSFAAADPDQALELLAQLSRAWQAATTLQAMGLFADSAEYHEAIADLADRSHPSYQKFEHARDASYNAVVLRVATGDTGGRPASEAVREICDPSGVRRLFAAADHKRAGRAAWTLLFYALWHRRHIEGRDLPPDTAAALAD